MPNHPNARERVVVVGAGPVGATTALGLAKLGFAVTIVDRAEPTVQRGSLGIDIRNFALNPRSQRFLASFIEWPPAQLAPYEHMVVWEERGTASIEFHAEDLGIAELGWLVEMSPLNVRLWRELQDRVDVVLNTVVAIHRSEHIEVVCETGDKIECDFLVAADGAQSKIRSLLQVKVEEHEVDQFALATVVRTEKPHAATAWQRFLLDGPVALLPSIEETLVSIVWSGSKETTQTRLSQSDAEFCQALSRASEFRLGEIQTVDARTSFPLTQRYVADPVIEDRIVLIGDAARVVHPLAGLGVNLGFEDVEALLEVAETASSLCGLGVWQKYQRGRRTRAQTMIRTLGALNQFYGTTNPGVGVLRNLGVDLINRTPTIKHQIMREAMGLGPLAR